MKPYKTPEEAKEAFEKYTTFARDDMEKEHLITMFAIGYISGCGDVTQYERLLKLFGWEKGVTK